MKNPIGIVVPNSINTPKKTAKQLHSIYTHTKLSQCQQLVAKLYGHKDWFSLENAIKHKMHSDPFDEDLPDNAHYERNHAQAALIAKTLSELDIDEAYMPPSEEYLAKLDFKARCEARLYCARERYWQKIAFLFIEDYSPTSNLTRLSEYPKEAADAELEDIHDLQIKIANWCDKYEPKLNLGTAVRNAQLDLNSRISLVRFGLYWGMLQMHCEGQLTTDLVLGTSYLLADRYADISLQLSSEFLEMQIEYVNGRLNQYIYDEEVLKLKQQHIRSYYVSYGLDELYESYIKYQESFRKSARNILKELN